MITKEIYTYPITCPLTRIAYQTRVASNKRLVSQITGETNPLLSRESSLLRSLLSEIPNHAVKAAVICFRLRNLAFKTVKFNRYRTIVEIKEEI